MKLRLQPRTAWSLFRFPVIIACLLALLVWTQVGMNRMAQSMNERLFYSGRLEESARFEAEVNRFFEIADLYAQGEPGVARSDVDLALNLMWSRAKVLSSASFRVVLADEQKDPALITEFVASLPEFDKGVSELRAGVPASYERIDTLRRRFAQRLAAFGELAWNARQMRMARSVEIGLENLTGLRWIQSGFALASVLAILYVLVELIVSRRMNKRLNRMVLEKQKMLRTDQLTAISNRFAFEEELSRRFEVGDSNFTVIYLDLDGFKPINDSHGHAAGDLLLQHVGSGLTTLAQEGDLVARLGGDEFAVLIPGNVERGRDFLEKALAAIATPAPDTRPPLSISASAGYCHASTLGPDGTPDILKRHADVALYAAKDAGRNCMREFSAFMLTEFERHQRLDEDLVGAIADARLEVAYQPIVVLADGSIHAMEALIRWNHPLLGPVPALEIILSATRCQQMQALTLMVLRNALDFQRRLRRQGQRVAVSVNIAPTLLEMEGFGGAIGHLLEEFEVAPGNLYLEVTEEGHLADTDIVEQNLKDIHRAGALIAIDDYGRAFSNMSRLTALEFCILKIDKTLVDPVVQSERARQIIEITDRMAQALGARTVCEGVETQEQADTLIKAGIAYAQGYHFARPMTAAAMEAYLDGKRLLPAQSEQREA